MDTINSFLDSPGFLNAKLFFIMFVGVFMILMTIKCWKTLPRLYLSMQLLFGGLLIYSGIFRSLTHSRGLINFPGILNVVSNVVDIFYLSIGAVLFAAMFINGSLDKSP